MPEILWPTLLIIASWVLLFAYWVSGQRKWKRAARRLGMTHHNARIGLPTHILVGSRDGHRVTITVDLATLSVVFPDVRLPDMKVVRQLGVHTLHQTATGTTDVQLGDPTLDGQLLLEGPRDVLLALVEPELREILVQTGCDLRVADDTLTLATIDRTPDCAEVLIDLGTRVCGIADLGVDEALLLRLEDPLPGIRRTALTELLQRAPPVADRAASRCLDASDSALRVLAMRHLRIGGQALEIALDRGADPRARLDALELLLEGGHPSLDAITSVLATAPDAVVAESLDLARGHLLSEHLPHAAALLDADGTTPVVRVAALHLIGALGTPACTAQLSGWRERGARSVRAAATEALGALRARHDLEDGALSLAEAAGGELTEAEPSRSGGMTLPSRATKSVEGG